MRFLFLIDRDVPFVSTSIKCTLGSGTLAEIADPCSSVVVFPKLGRGIVLSERCGNGRALSTVPMIEMASGGNKRLDEHPMCVRGGSSAIGLGYRSSRKEALAGGSSPRYPPGDHRYGWTAGNFCK